MQGGEPWVPPVQGHLAPRCDPGAALPSVSPTAWLLWLLMF